MKAVNPCGIELLTKEDKEIIFVSEADYVRISAVNKIPYSKSFHYTSHSIDIIFTW